MTDLAKRFKPLLIRASAGAGKTYKLTNRYIDLLAEGEKPERILATTFTRKAAGEIQERVFSRLASAALDPKEAQKIAKDIERDDLSPKRAEEILTELISKQNRLNICTLDSFFSKIARSFALELGLNADWTVADGLSEKRLQGEAIRLVCQDEESKDLVSLVRLLHKGSSGRPVHSQIERVVGSLYELYEESTEEVWNCPSAAPKLQAEELKALKSSFSKLPLPKTKGGKTSSAFEKAVKDGAFALEANDWIGFISKGIPKSVLEGKEAYSKIAIPDQFIEVCTELIKQARAVLLERLRRQTLATYHLLEMYAENFRKIKSASGMLGFADVKIRLSEASLMQELEELYYRLDCTISHLLLDEFQDTSKAEWTIIKPVVAEILSKASGEASFFCVGDVKQAIYGWRGGVAEIFDTLKQRWDHLYEESLDESYRCSQPVIDAVNRVFEGIEDNKAFEEYPQASLAWAKRFSIHKTARSEYPGFVQLIEAEQQAGQEAGETSIKRAVSLVKEIVSANPDLSIGVLVRKKATVARIIFELNRGDDAIKASEEGGNPLTDSPPVLLILSLLILVDHPGDTIARYHVMESPLGSHLELSDFEDDRRTYLLGQNIRRRIEEEGLGPVIYRWTEGLKDFVSHRDQRRLKQLVELAYRFDGMASSRISEFVELVNLERIEDPASSNVRVMTIHQSKGLEFKVVVLPELDGKLIGNFGDVVMTCRDTPIGPPSKICRTTSKEVRSLSEELQEIHRNEVSESLKEALSVLYVALTRARNALYMVVRPGKDVSRMSFTTAKILRLALQSGDPDGESLYQTGDPAWMDKLRSQESEATSSKSIPKTIKLKPSTGKRKLSWEAPSDKEGSKTDLFLKFGSYGRAAATRGIILHRLLEEIEWLSGKLPDQADLIGSLEKMGPLQVSKEEIADEFFSALKGENVRELLSQDHYNKEGRDGIDLYREYPFIYREGGKAVSGIIDRLVVLREGERVVAAEVIDYKTDRLSLANPEEIQERSESYRAQLDAYKKAVVRLFGLDPKRVSAKIAFVSIDQIIEL